MTQIPWAHIQNSLCNSQQEDDKELLDWLNAADENRAYFEEIKLSYLLTGHIPEPFTTSNEKAWGRIQKRIEKKTGGVKINRVLLRIAASLLLFALGMGGSMIVQKIQATKNYTEVFSPYGHKTRVVLPDSTTVWLNGNTRLKYCSDFSQNRDLELRGEALFSVTKDSHHAFTAKVGKLNVEVYGTTFNLKSYDDDNITEVALLEGSIGIFQNKKELKRMVPGEVVRYDTQRNVFHTSKENLDFISSWTRDELIIENETFGNVIKYLQRWYGVEIMVDKSLKLDSRLSFSVKTESLTELMSVINYLVPINYKIEGKTLKISNARN